MPKIATGWLEIFCRYHSVRFQCSDRVPVVRHCPLAGRDSAQYTILAVLMTPNRPARDRYGTCGEPQVNCM
jgi:hypothetical protein